MRTLVKLAVLAAVAYFAYTQILPRFQEHQETEKSADQAVVCVDAAESVTDDFFRELSGFGRPPVDRDVWSSFMLQSSGRLSQADVDCRCAEPACITAAAALLEQRKLLNRFDAMVRGESTGIANPASSRELIAGLVSRARSELN